MRSGQRVEVASVFPMEAPEANSNGRVQNAEAGGERPSDPIDTMVVRFEPGFFTRFIERDWSSWLGWKAGLATALGIMLGIVAWKAARPVAPLDLVNSGASAKAVQVAPTIVPLASPESAAEPGALRAGSVRPDLSGAVLTCAAGP